MQSSPEKKSIAMKTDNITIYHFYAFAFRALFQAWISKGETLLYKREREC